MKGVIIAVLAVTAVVCAVGWLCYWISAAALLLYIQGKGYTLPSDKETKACIKAVIQNIIKYDIKGM